MSERIDVVDRQGRALRVLSRKQVHRRGLLHCAVRVLLFNKKGQVFIQQRAANKDINPSLWEGSLAGHQKHHETPVQAAARETKEELGIRIPQSRFKSLGHYLVKNKDHLYYTLFQVKGVSKTPKLDPREVAAGHWETPAAVTKHTRMHPHKYTKGFLVAWKLVTT